MADKDPWAAWAIVPESSHQADTAPVDTSIALKLAAAGNTVPMASHAAMEIATSPNAAKTGAAIGQVLGGVEGALKGGPMGAAGGVWTGGKAGWFTGKLAQRMAGPIASVAEKIAPYAQTLSTIAGAQGVDDLAQMAEPDRKDIGFIGLGKSADVPKDKLDAIYVSAIDNGIKNFGYSPSKAAAVIAKGDPKVFGAAMSAYMMSRMVK